MLQALSAGTVIVFVENGEAKDSCVVLPEQQIGGNNQTGWYTPSGIGGRYSTVVYTYSCPDYLNISALTWKKPLIL